VRALRPKVEQDARWLLDPRGIGATATIVSLEVLTAEPVDVAL